LTIKYREGIKNVAVFMYEKLEMSQEDIAKLIGVTQPAVSSYLKQKNHRKIDKILA